jgi:hypothetical protein
MFFALISQSKATGRPGKGKAVGTIVTQPHGQDGGRQAKLSLDHHLAGFRRAQSHCPWLSRLNVCLHDTIGYITPTDKIEGREHTIFAEPDPQTRSSQRKEERTSPGRSPIGPCGLERRGYNDRDLSGG